MRKKRSKKAMNIRAVPEDLYAQIKSRAKSEHRTLRKWVLHALEAQLGAKPPKKVEAPTCPEDSKPMEWIGEASS